MAPPYGSSTHSYGRSNRIALSAEDEEKIRELERLREEYLKRQREEDEKEKERAAIDAHVVGVTEMEMHPSYNSKEHNTTHFDLLLYSDPSLIVRRGQPFKFSIHFKRQYDLKQDSIVLQFTIGTNPRANKGTLIRLPITDNNSFTMPIEEWDVRLDNEEPQTMDLKIQISCKAAVGLWKLNVILSHPNAPGSREHKIKNDIYILFNPWCKDDAVYMEDETNRREYVLTATGKLFSGNYENPKFRRWIYGQFSAVVLPAAIAILEKSSLDDIGRGSPAKVVRAISAMINSEDDDGVLVGRWEKPYDDGTAPYEWTGSTEILKRYLTNGFKPIKYGQCWVFAGLFTTVCRALGIPCRPVTNYRSAHDTNDTLTIDRYFTAEGDKLEDSEGAWNFHVWNDCWMTRPDLPTGYGGWQAVDSTPQETSDGIYQTGPASVYAVKRGEIGYMYDTPFVFSEVNADIIHWKIDSTQPMGWRKIKTEKYTIGPLIVTKKAGVMDLYGDEDMENITEQYKYTEGSSEERLAVRNAATHGSYSMLLDVPPIGTGDVFFDMREIDKIMIGQAFSVIFYVENKANESRKITVALTAESIYYTGIKADTIKHEKQKFVLQPKEKKEWAMKVTAHEYYEKLVDYSMIKIYAMATAKETKQTWAEEDDIVLEKPRLNLEVTHPPQVGQKFGLSIEFENPLLLTLRNCTLVVESPGLSEYYRYDVGDVMPEIIFACTLPFTPTTAGKKVIFVIFNSKELIDVQGFLEVEVI